MAETIFKIRRSTDGLYSRGGESPSFDTKGKVWKRRGDVSSHLSQLSEAGIRRFYSDCQIVEYVIVQSDVETVPDAYRALRNRRDPIDKARERANLQEQVKHLEAQRDHLEQQILKLRGK